MMKSIKTVVFLIATIAFSMFCNAEVRKSSIAALSMMRNAIDNKITARSYIQDGLFSQWDGIENVGYGRHDSTSTQWISLTGNSVIPYVAFDDDSATPTGPGPSQTDSRLATYKIDSDFTLHGCLVICPFRWYNWTMLGIGTGSAVQNGICFSGMNGDRGNSVCYRSAYSGIIFNSVGTRVTEGQTYSIDIIFQHSIKTYYVYINAAYIGESQILDANWNLDDINVSIGFIFNRIDDLGDFCMHSILYYKRMLTQDEILYNYEIDKMRFNLL